MAEKTAHASAFDSAPAGLGEGLLLDIDRSSPVPLYFQVASRLEQAILSGELPAGLSTRERDRPGAPTQPVATDCPPGPAGVGGQRAACAPPRYRNPGGAAARDSQGGVDKPLRRSQPWRAAPGHRPCSRTRSSPPTNASRNAYRCHRAYRFCTYVVSGSPTEYPWQCWRTSCRRNSRTCRSANSSPVGSTS